MFERVNDKVAVLASFEPLSHKAVHVRPYFLKWRGRKYKVDVMGGHHLKKLGDKRVLVCGFKAGSNDFTIEFHPDTFEWRLVEVYYGD